MNIEKVLPKKPKAYVKNKETFNKNLTKNSLLLCIKTLNL